MNKQLNYLETKLTQLFNYTLANPILNNNVQQEVTMKLENLINVVQRAKSGLQDSNTMYWAKPDLAVQGNDQPQYFTNYPNYATMSSQGVASKSIQPLTLSQIESGDLTANELYNIPQDYLVMNSGNKNVEYTPWGEKGIVNTNQQYSSTPKNIVSKTFTPFSCNKWR